VEQREPTKHDANRRIIAEVCPPGHREVSGAVDRQIIVGIGGGSGRSSSADITLNIADARPDRRQCRGSCRTIISAISAGISRPTPRAGGAGSARAGSPAVKKDGAAAHPSPDESRSRPPLISAMCCRRRDPLNFAMNCRSSKHEEVVIC
jgi:hypothetical protein